VRVFVLWTKLQHVPRQESDGIHAAAATTVSIFVVVVAAVVIVVIVIVIVIVIFDGTYREVDFNPFCFLFCPILLQRLEDFTVVSHAVNNFI
jgi:flagellar biosynthesis protein FlhB